MRHERLPIQAGNERAWLYTYLLDGSREQGAEKRRPLALICPGGGYRFTSDREAEPIALQMNAMGYHAAILRYSVSPATFPAALLQLAQSVALARLRADEWNVLEDRVMVAGFSAGGHLAASLGVFWNKGWIEKEIGHASSLFRPDGLVLCYPVITSGVYAHRGSMEHLLGEKKSDLRALVSLEDQIDAQTPPCFVWHTFEDEAVPLENSLLFVNRLRACGVPFEFHVFPRGRHGLALATPESGDDCPPGVSDWVRMAGRWIGMPRA